MISSRIKSKYLSELTRIELNRNKIKNKIKYCYTNKTNIWYDNYYISRYSLNFQNYLEFQNKWTNNTIIDREIYRLKLVLKEKLNKYIIKFIIKYL